jgi:UDP-GlcNAc:undecaprenyl-phosphate GlcNAc-1-phosphate transferase
MHTIKYSLIALAAFLAGLSLIFLIKKFSLKHKFLMHGKIPLVGGVAMCIAFMLACLASFVLYGNLSSRAIGIIIGSFMMLVFGIIDDRYELSVIAKFLVQILAISVLILSDVRTHIVYIPDTLNIIITFVWVLGITNAFNHLDVMDGVAGVTAMIVSLAFFVISVLNGDTTTAVLSLALTGAVLSFLIYNLPPARIYMGNSGSHFLGFFLAAIAMAISYASMERKAALLTPLLILGFPIFDTTFLILIRISKRKMPFEKSNDHFALRLLALGYSSKQALLIMTTLAIFFTLCGVIVSQASNRVALATVVFVVFISLALIKKMSIVRIDV